MSTNTTVAEIRVDAAPFALAVHRVAGFAGKDDTLPALTGVELTVRRGRLVLAATDRYVMAAHVLDWAQPSYHDHDGQRIEPENAAAFQMLLDPKPLLAATRVHRLTTAQIRRRAIGEAGEPWPVELCGTRLTLRVRPDNTATLTDGPDSTTGLYVLPSEFPAVYKLLDGAVENAAKVLDAKPGEGLPGITVTPEKLRVLLGAAVQPERQPVALTFTGTNRKPLLATYTDGQLLALVMPVSPGDEFPKPLVTQLAAWRSGLLADETAA